MKRPASSFTAGSPDTRMNANLPIVLAVVLAVASGCELFSPRTPDPPLEGGGTYLQPDTPSQVVENIQNAVAELNAQNYRRSFADDLRFEPTAAAEASDPSIWTGWGDQEEESYFRALVEAARLTADNELRLNDVDETAGDMQHTLDATYLLTINHRRDDLPKTLQGRLVWTIEQGGDGLWRVTRWTDRSLDDAASWSDLKAAFIK